MSRQSLTSFSTRIIISSKGLPQEAFLLYTKAGERPEMSQRFQELPDLGENCFLPELVLSDACQLLWTEHFVIFK